MREPQPREEPAAFQEALLKSERLRILIVISGIGVAFVAHTLQTGILHSRENLHLWFVTLLWIAPFVGYELLMLLSVIHALQISRNLPNAVWISTIVVESCLPAIAVAFLPSVSLDPAYRPVANPAVLVFFVFIILSTLRLNPIACRVSGLVAAVSYLAAAVHLGWTPILAGGVSLLSPQVAVYSYAITLVVAGFAAGAVAGEIRKQVDTALHDAKMRLRVDRLEDDIEVARSIQQSLLPRDAPHIEGFDIAGWNRPADPTGGDYYDWQRFPDGAVLVTLGDVTGHGVGSALLAAACHAYQRATFTAESGLLIGIERMNTALAHDMFEGLSATFVVVLCRPNSSHVELLSAGHGPLFLYSLREDRFDKMGAQGLPLGLFPDLSYEPPVILEVNPGDLLVLVTDGFFEWTNSQDEPFGTERIEQTIRTAREQSPGDIISALHRAVVDFSGGTKQLDDLTAVVIKRVDKGLICG